MDSRQVIRSIAVFGFLFLAAWAAETQFYAEPDIPEISYNRFLDRIFGNRVESVLIGEDKIFGILKPAAKKSKDQTPPLEEIKVPRLPLRHTPWRLDLEGLASKIKLPEYEPIESDPNASSEPRYFVVTAIENPDLITVLRNQKVDFSARLDHQRLENFLLNWIVPVTVVGLFWIMVSSRRRRPPPGVLEFGSPKIRIFRERTSALPRFSDLAGIDRGIDESREIVIFLKGPERFTQLGASLPKGVLLVGPAGSGKTLLARALGGESGVPFFNLDGIEFRERFSGAGAPKIKEMFQAAKRRAPCILFIDGLDAMIADRARRDLGFAANCTESIQDQLLFELDKLDGRAGIMLVASVSDPEMLDPAWFRPSRFNRRIVLERPYKESREQLLRKLCGRLVLAEDIDFSELATETIGMVGAEIVNLCNESALLAARCNRENVTHADFREALQKATAALRQKGLYLDRKNREIKAYHEAGHALIRHFDPDGESVRKVSLLPGFFDCLENAFPPPDEDRPMMTKTELLGKIRTLLAGRAAEETVFGEVSTEASDDLAKANRLIRKMLIDYGMSRRLPNLCLARDRSAPEFQPESAYSAKAERVIGPEHIEILDAAYQEARALVKEHRASLDRVAKRLLEKEKIGAKELKEILGSRAAAAVAEPPPPERGLRSGT